MISSPIPNWNPGIIFRTSLEQASDFLRHAGAEPRPNKQKYMYLLAQISFFVRKIGASLKTQWRTSGAANTWIPYWNLCIFLCKTYKRLGFRNCWYLIIFIFCIIFSLLFFIWWMFGVARVLGPARSYQRGITTELGIYDDPIMEDPECKLYMFTFPFWLSIVPFIFIGFFILFTCTFGVVDSYCCED